MPCLSRLGLVVLCQGRSRRTEALASIKMLNLFSYFKFTREAMHRDHSGCTEFHFLWPISGTCYVSGDVPYPEIQAKDLLQSLKSGYRIEKPVKSSSVMWVLFFSLRSSFVALRSPLYALRSPLSALRSPLSALCSPLFTLHPSLVAWHQVSLIYWFELLQEFFESNYIVTTHRKILGYFGFDIVLFFINSYEVMTKCWQAAPNDRPKFSELCMVLETMVTRETSCWNRKTLVPQLGPFRTTFSLFLVRLSS